MEWILIQISKMNYHCQHLDLEPLNSRIMRRFISIILSHLVGICYSSSRKITYLLCSKRHQYSLFNTK